MSTITLFNPDDADFWNAKPSDQNYDKDAVYNYWNEQTLIYRICKSKESSQEKKLSWTSTNKCWVSVIP